MRDAVDEHLVFLLLLAEARGHLAKGSIHERELVAARQGRIERLLPRQAGGSFLSRLPAA